MLRVRSRITVTGDQSTDSHLDTDIDILESSTFLLLRNMRREADSIEPGHLSIESQNL